MPGKKKCSNIKKMLIDRINYNMYVRNFNQTGMSMVFRFDWILQPLS